LLLTTLAFQGVSGIAGGLGLTFDPTGESVGLPLGWLEGSPFASYLVPGIVLMTLLGIGPLVTLFGVWKSLTWARPAALGVGVLLFAWLGVEIAVVGYQPEPPLQLVYGIVALLILLTTPFAQRAPTADAR
jgi:hypothetical protein